ncbi:hypothetical protein ACG95N_04615 [Acinetobacter guillouiae]|uniref:hypothetical protein n=1 Tax=Acinetobacter guillouiae TaxID=106649 RepID=UPI003AF78CCA
MNRIVSDFTHKQQGAITWNNDLQPSAYFDALSEDQFSKKRGMLNYQKWNLMFDIPVIMNDVQANTVPTLEQLIRCDKTHKDFIFKPQTNTSIVDITTNPQTWFTAIYAECPLDTTASRLVCDGILIARLERGIYPN